MASNEGFVILDSVESTNNYAMQQLNGGKAAHGQAWFAKEQWGGKGQRGKSWVSAPNENIILSIALKPHHSFRAKPFLLSAFIANICRAFLEKETAHSIKIKWPNDLYFGDRKAGGILIENSYKNKDWQWAVIGIGINVNETEFAKDISNAISLGMITTQKYDPILLAKKLHQKIINDLEENLLDAQKIMETFNDYLYKKNEIVTLKKDTILFETKIIAVNDYGQLVTENKMEERFDIGEVFFLSNFLWLNTKKPSNA